MLQLVTFKGLLCGQVPVAHLVAVRANVTREDTGALQALSAWPDWQHDLGLCMLLFAMSNATSLKQASARNSTDDPHYMDEACNLNQVT